MKRITPLALAVASAISIADEELPMEHVLVSMPIHKTEAETALPITVITGEELRREASATIGDMLSKSPGLANASFGPGVGQPVVRGQAGPRVTVLQNGTSSADAANISADHAVSVEPLLADSVEVIRGPGTLLYGGGAIGGVVNVIDNRVPTNLPEEVTGALEYRHDTASSGDTIVGRLEGSVGNFAWHVSGLSREWDSIEIPGRSNLFEEEEEHDDHDDEHEDEHDDEHDDEHEHEEEGSYGVVENTDGETQFFTIGGAYHFDKGFIGISVSRLENEYGIPPGAHGHHDEEEHHDDEHEEDEHEEDHDEHEDEHDEEHEDEHDEEEEVIRLDVEQTRYDAVVHVHEPFDGFEIIRGFLTYTDYEHVELEGVEVGTMFSNETWEGRLEAVHNFFGNFHGSLGIQAKSGEFEALGEEAFIPLTESTEIGLFLVEDYHAERWTLETGIRLDLVDRETAAATADDADFTSLSLSAALLYDITDEWQVGVAVMRSERAPAIEELFSNVDALDPEDWITHAATQSIELGNPDLDTEVSGNIDVTLSWLTDDHQFAITGFYNNFKDYIGLINTGLEEDETPVLAYENSDAVFAGIELDSKFRLVSLADGDLHLEVQGDFVYGEFDNHDDIPRLPPRRVSAELSWANDHWYIHGGVLDASEQDKPGRNESRTPGYTRWDAGIEFRTGLASDSDNLVLFVNFKNITDEEIRLSTSFLREFSPEAGRSVEAGIRLMM